MEKTFIEHKLYQDLTTAENRDWQRLVSASLFEEEDKLVFSTMVRKVWTNQKAGGETWSATGRGARAILSFKGGRVNLYFRFPAKRKKGKYVPPCLINATPSADLIGKLNLTGTTVEGDSSSLMDRMLPLTQRLIRETMERMGMECPAELPGTLHETIWAIAYPVVGELLKAGYKNPENNLPKMLTRFLRGRTIQDVARRAFGKAGTKHMAKLLWQSLLADPIVSRTRWDWRTGEMEEYQAREIRWDNFCMAVLAQGLVTPDHLQQILQWPVQGGMSPDQMESVDLPAIRHFLKRFDAPRVMRFLRESYDQATAHYLGDTARMVRNNPEIPMPARIRSLRELHDHFALAQRLRGHRDFPIPLHPKVAAQEGKMVGDMEIIFPHSSHQLVEWGHTMHHCIASYAHEAKAGDCLLIGVVRDGRLTYNLMLEPKRQTIVQFYGACNAAPDPEDKRLITDWVNRNQDLWAGCVAHFKGQGMPTVVAIEVAAPAIVEELPNGFHLDEDGMVRRHEPLALNDWVGREAVPVAAAGPDNWLDPFADE